MIFPLMTVGFISGFALGPASFNIIRNLLSQRTWPWESIAGFLLGDLIYIAAALMLLQSPLIHIDWLRGLLTGLTAVFLSLYAGRILLPSLKNRDSEPTQPPRQGFRGSLFLTLSNFHLILIYAGLFAGIPQQRDLPLWLGVGLYFATFLVSFFSILWGLRYLQKSLQTALRKIEIVAAFGFLGFSVYLTLELL